MHAAAAHGDVAMLKLLLECGGQEALEIFDPLDRTPLHCAIDASSLAAVQFLLAAGSDPNALSHVTLPMTIGNPPLRRAVKGEHGDIVRLLLEHGADPDRPGWMWCTARDDAERLTGPQGEEIRALLEVPLLRRPADTPHRAEIERQLVAEAARYGLAAARLHWKCATPTGPCLQVRGQPLQPTAGMRVIHSEGKAIGAWDFVALTVELEFRVFWTELSPLAGEPILKDGGIPLHLWEELTDEQRSWLPRDGRNQRWRHQLRSRFRTG